jgi:NADPH:quinone reductase-like Zn-dependent oxidoreductase
MGFSKPRQPVLGMEFAGEVAALGRKVQAFRTGDRVFGITGARLGCHAEYLCMPDTGAVAHMPATLTFDEAAALPFGGTTMTDFFRKAKLRRGERVLVNGASGSVGTAALQLARRFGADTTAVCSGANADLVTSLGAARVTDYTSHDFTANGERYDVIVDAVGNAPFARCRNSLNRGGRLLLLAAGLPDMIPMLWVNLSGASKIIAGSAAERAEDLRFLAELAYEGQFKAVIDRRYPLEQIAEAHRYVETGRKKGSVVITVLPS